MRCASRRWYGARWVGSTCPRRSQPCRWVEWFCENSGVRMVAVLKPRIIVSVTRTRWNLETQTRVCCVVVAAVCGCEWRYPNTTADTRCAALRACGCDARGSHFCVVNATAYTPISVLTHPVVIPHALFSGVPRKSQPRGHYDPVGLPRVPLLRIVQDDDVQDEQGQEGAEQGGDADRPHYTRLCGQVRRRVVLCV
jgi:hypothetical protein